MFNKIFKTSLVLTAAVLPVLVSAQDKLGTTYRILYSLKSIVTDILIPLVFTLALLFFFYGVAKYIWSEGQNKAEGKQIMIWGVVALFVMSSVWGLVAFIQGELSIESGTTGTIPTIK